jgi:hypothetical protein
LDGCRRPGLDPERFTAGARNGGVGVQAVKATLRPINAAAWKQGRELDLQDKFGFTTEALAKEATALLNNSKSSE